MQLKGDFCTSRQGIPGNPFVSCHDMQLCPQNCTSRQRGNLQRDILQRPPAANRSDPQRQPAERYSAARHSAANPSDSDSKACGRHPVTRSPSAEQRSMLLGHVTTCNLRVIFARRGRDFPEILAKHATGTCYDVQLSSDFCTSRHGIPGNPPVSCHDMQLCLQNCTSRQRGNP